jgi:GGDEF domain-containing protein
MRALAAAARTVAEPGAGDDALARALTELAEATGIGASFTSEQELQVRWPKCEADHELRAAFEQALGDLLLLAREAIARSGATTLDAPSFLRELERCASAARWRDKRLALCVFDVDGLILGPGTDETRLVELVGAAARGSVRQGDMVGHLGAGRFALLFPRAGTFEARAAFKRVRDAVALLDLDGHELACGAAGFAELDEYGTGDLLGEALARLQAARVRHAYTGPVGPSSPTQPLAG